MAAAPPLGILLRLERVLLLLVLFSRLITGVLGAGLWCWRKG